VVFHNPSKKHLSGGNVLRVSKERKIWRVIQESGGTPGYSWGQETGDRSEEADYTPPSVMTSFGQLSQLIAGQSKSRNPHSVVPQGAGYCKAVNGM